MNRSGDWLLDGRQKFDSRQRRCFAALHTTCVSHPAPHTVALTDSSPTSSAEIRNLPSKTSTFAHITLIWYWRFQTTVLNLPQMEDECLASDYIVQVLGSLWALDPPGQHGFTKGSANWHNFTAWHAPLKQARFCLLIIIIIIITII